MPTTALKSDGNLEPEAAEAFIERNKDTIECATAKILDQIVHAIIEGRIHLPKIMKKQGKFKPY